MLFALVSAFAQDPAPCTPGTEGCTSPPPLGALEKSVIDSVVKAKMGRYRACYGQGLRIDRTLAGMVAVRFVIAVDGTVSSATTKRTTLEAPTVESCLNKQFMGLVFPPPEGGGMVIVTYPFVFTPDAAPGLAVVEGGRPSTRRVSKALARARAAATACSAPSATRGARFVITEEGIIDEVRVIGVPTPTDAEQACVSEALASVHFPPPGAQVPVYYSLVVH